MVRTTWIALPLLVIALARIATAQDSTVHLRRDTEPRQAAPHENTSSVIATTPEMWYYQQEIKRHDDPKMAIRRRAELKAQQRHERLASLQWYGISNARPTVSTSPQFGNYSTYWGSNTYDPLRWRPMPAPVVITR
jgi:hypothetical protein